MKNNYACEICGVSVSRVPSAVHGHVFCSRECTGKSLAGKPSKRRKMAGPDASRWKGGRIIHKSTGYILIWKPDHVHADKRGYVLEHRMLMSDKLDRPLEEWEHVHHINGVRDDNRIENLQLTSRWEHQTLHKGTKDGRGDYPRGWVRLGHGCILCNTTSEPHYCRKMCRKCHHRLKARENRAKARASR